MIRLLAARAHQSEASLRPRTYVHTDANALRRIFGVASSLDSQVLGEPQVLGQVKAAHALARAAKMMGPELDTALQAAYGAAKRARTETAIGQRPVTLASAALQLARDVHGDLARCVGVAGGHGRAGRIAGRASQGRGLAQPGDHEPEPWPRRAAGAAAVVPCRAVRAARKARWPTPTSSSRRSAAAHHVIARAAMDRVMVAAPPARGAPGRPRHSGRCRSGGRGARRRVPLRSRRSGARDDERPRLARRAAAEAWAIVEQELASFARTRAERDAVPAIVALRRHFEAVRAQVLRQANGDAVRATELLVNRLLHDPSEALRRIAAGEGETLTDSALAERVVARAVPARMTMRRRATRRASGEFRSQAGPGRGAPRGAAPCDGGPAISIRGSSRSCRRSTPSSGRSSTASQNLRKLRVELAGLEAMMADGRRSRDEGAGGGGALRAEGAAAGARAPGPAHAAAEGRGRREERHPRGPRRHRRRRGGAVRGRPVPHVPALRRAARLEVRDHGARRHRHRRLQGGDRRDHRAAACSRG